MMLDALVFVLGFVIAIVVAAAIALGVLAFEAWRARGGDYVSREWLARHPIEVRTVGRVEHQLLVGGRVWLQADEDTVRGVKQELEARR